MAFASIQHCSALRNFLRLFGGTISLAVSFAILNNTVKDAGGLDPETIKAVVRDPTKIRSLPGVDEQTRQLILQCVCGRFYVRVRAC